MHFATVLAQVLSGASLALHAVGQYAFQTPLQVPGGSAAAFSAYDEGLFTPLGDLSSLSSTTFTRLAHPAFPRHSVRVKQSHFCDEQVRAYTGYIDIEARHLFFYFFESRRDPDKDDIMFWTNGGPGGSSAIGLFTELGPCRVTSANSTERNPWSWNEYANIFFVDQPVDVGYSYAEYGEAVTTTQEAANDIGAFMVIFFEHFTKFRGRPLHLAGESYGGRYIPVFASAIYDKNAELTAAGVAPINLTSVMIGNGCTDFSTMLLSYYDAQCADPTLGLPISDISSCVHLKQQMTRCEQRFKDSCLDIFDAIDCRAAFNVCVAATDAHFKNPNRNYYDRTPPCTGMTSTNDCYPIIGHMVDFLSSNTTQDLLGVDPAKRGPFHYESRAVFDAFQTTYDWYAWPAPFYLAALLERGVRALVYVGAADYICNWIGNERMTLGLAWTRQEEFRNQSLAPWLVDREVAGVMRSGGGLTFATIDGAGHFAPLDRPVQSLELAKRWLDGAAL